MLSAAGLSGGTTVTKKPSALAPPPSGTGKIRSPLPPPPNDPAAARMTSGHGVGLQDPKENTRRAVDAFADLSQIEVLPSLLSLLLFLGACDLNLYRQLC